MTAYYNEIDPYAAAWLRNLIAGDHITPGDVDERSIEDVCPTDLAGYTQHHFFAGIGGWSYALRLADWPDDRPIWTGSCPCQPFSAAGKGAGFADERHLWPAFFHLIRELRPQRVVGEQVASNLAWLDLVQGDLEGEGYAVGATIVGAHSVGAPHIRQRLYWMADQQGGGRREERADAGGQFARERAQGRAAGLELGGRAGCGLAYNAVRGCSLERRGGLLDGERPTLRHDADGRSAECDGLADSSVERRQQVTGGTSSDESAHGRRTEGDRQSASPGEDAGDGLGHRHHQGLEGWSLRGSGRAGECAPWEASVLVACADGKLRPIPAKPALFPLAYGVPGRVGRLRAIGNAVVPQVAAAFIRALP